MHRKPGPTTTLMIRTVPRAAQQQLRQGAAARGLTHAQYLAALLALHEAMRALESPAVRAELTRLGLETVTA